MSGQPTVPPNDEKEIDLLLTWLKVVEQRKPVIAFVIGCMALFATWTLVVPPIYEAKTSLIVPVKSSRDVGLAGALGIVAPGASPTSMIEAVLKSETTLETVAGQVGLKKKKLRKMVKISRVRGFEVVWVKVEDKDKDRALRIAGAYVSSLEAQFEELNVPSKSEDATALKAALDERAAELAEADEALKQFDSEAVTDLAAAETFRSRLRIFEVDLQAIESGLEDARKKTEQKAGVASDQPTDLPPAVAWRDKVVDLQYRLDVAQLRYGDKHPQVVNLQAEVDQALATMESEIAAYLKSVREGNLDPTGVQLDGEQGTRIVGLESQRVALQAKVEAMNRIVEKIPEEQKMRQELTRDIGTLEEVVSRLTVQHEQARISETVDPNRWEVLDPPHLADRPVNKSYAKSLVLGLLLGLVLGVAYVVRRAS
ncbi:MAG: hypothetical protein IH945_00410 [Armatimonadetes bacterium]|nr:hypothetical protein [Armatimonadota bacterium]